MLQRVKSASNGGTEYKVVMSETCGGSRRLADDLDLIDFGRSEEREDSVCAKMELT